MGAPFVVGDALVETGDCVRGEPAGAGAKIDFVRGTQVGRRWCWRLFVHRNM
jgi:hypothetical protein